MGRRETIDSILRLADAERAADGDVREELRLVRERLEDTLGESVRPAEAARVLGISQPALSRWLDRNEIATVITPRGRREIPIPELIRLRDEAARARASGRERALAAAMRERRGRAEREADFDRLVPSRREPRSHRGPERMSLAYHRLLAERLTPDVVEEARARLRRWERADRIDPRWAREWHAVLGGSLNQIAQVIASDGGRARALRQTSPFAGMLTEHERRRLLAGSN